jgi:crotonobetainyl-CoA:carnitine CoA-transferase CaiB-like acyl-CoA transferase
MSARAPLEGIRVLDFTHGVAGPYCSAVLGDLGADVVKIEKPERGDPTRYMNVSERFHTRIPEVGGDYFLAINRNKRSIALDLKTDAGREVALGLARWADVAVQNFRPGVLERAGLGYQALRTVNPRIILANLSAYGEGPFADKPGMDVAVQARSGVMRITGVPGSDEPVKPGASLADFGGGIYLVTAVLAALLDRGRTGEGQEVSVSLLDATMALLSNFSVAVMDGQAELAPMGSGHPQLVPYQAFPTRDGFVVVSAGTNKIYRIFCAAIGLPELGEDPRFRTNQDRVRHRAELVPLLSAATQLRATAEWLDILEAADVPCAPVNDMREAFEDLQRISPDMVVPVAHPGVGTLHLCGVPFRFGAMEGSIRRPPPMLGEHTEEVLRGILDYDEADIERLRACKAI